MTAAKQLKPIINILFEASPILQEVETVPKFSVSSYLKKKRKERR